jgi:outer membrane immunogenic protein
VKNLLLAGVALVALAAPAAAADMPLKAPAPVAIDIWTGGYVGANVGYDWGRDTITSTGSPGSCTNAGAGCATAPVNGISPIQAQAATFNATVNHSGLIYGGQAGHNWLVHNIAWTWDGVLGVEVDFQGKSDSHTNTYTSSLPILAFPPNTINQTVTLNEKLSTLGTLRGRAGVLWGPNTLIYATAGVAWASASSSGVYTQLNTGTPASLPLGALPGTGTGSVNTELFGPVIGGGIEWKWTANWSVKAEYLYVDLGNLTYNTGLIQNFQANGAATYGTATANVNAHVHDNIARVGVNYRFW